MVERNGWNSYQKLVLLKLDEHGEAIESVQADIQSIRLQDIPSLQVEIATLKVKAGVWGAIAGMIPASMAILAMWYQNK